MFLHCTCWAWDGINNHQQRSSVFEIWSSEYTLHLYTCFEYMTGCTTLNVSTRILNGFEIWSSSCSQCWQHKRWVCVCLFISYITHTSVVTFIQATWSPYTLPLASISMMTCTIAATKNTSLALGEHYLHYQWCATLIYLSLRCYPQIVVHTESHYQWSHRFSYHPPLRDHW